MTILDRQIKLYAIIAVLFLAPSAWSENEVEYKPLSIGAIQEFGLVNSGAVNGGILPFENLWVDHLGAFLNQEASINNNIDIAVGFGGIFQFPIPEGDPPGPKYPSLRTRFFFIGPSGHILYKFGEPEKPWLKIKGGNFIYKYNSEAYNLGEYLFRSEPYPNSLFTGGYAVINNAFTFIQGVMAQFQFGNLGLDVMAMTETGMPPFYDISLAAVANYKIADGLLEFGAGINVKRLIPLANEASKIDKVPANSYFDYQGETYTGMADYYKNPAVYYELQADSLRSLGDTVQAMGVQATGDSLRSIANFVGLVNGVRSDRENGTTNILQNGPIIQASILVQDSIIAAGGTPAFIDSVTQYRDSLSRDLNVINTFTDYDGQYSASGTILMGRMTFNAGSLIGGDWLGPEDLKLFLEVSLLGVKDYPLFYDDKAERMPIMLGINIPTFKLLDLLSFQVEYYNSPHLNNYWNRGLASANIPFSPGGGEAFFSREGYNDVTDNDNWSWSVLMKRNIIPGISVSAQVARDHIRLVADDFFYGPGLDSQEMTPWHDNWYWVIQIGMGI